MQVLEEAAKALEVARLHPTAPLRDHRPLVLNQLDYQRVAAMERREGFSMRDAPGVVVHPNSELRLSPGSLAWVAGHIRTSLWLLCLLLRCSADCKC